MGRNLSRRDFLKLSALTVSPFLLSFSRIGIPTEDQVPPVGIARVTISSIPIFQTPSYRSEKVGWRKRDQLLAIIEEIHSTADKYIKNKRWYRVIGGYAHSAYLQRVDGTHLNAPLESIPETGQLAEVTVPFSQSYRPARGEGWSPLYRLYFGTTHWVTRLEEGPDGEPWYGLTDDRLHVLHYVPAAHLRPIPRSEITPISTQVPPEEKHIEVSTSEQVMRAYEYDRLVFEAKISSGVASRGKTPNGIPTDTPQGQFHISMKMPSRHMGDGELTSDLRAYELPGVPWVSFFHSIGVGFHGTYWHDNFGTRMSHGCVNMRNEDAKWLYCWTTPETSHSDWYKKGWGTVVRVV